MIPYNSQGLDSEKISFQDVTGIYRYVYVVWKTQRTYDFYSRFLLHFPFIIQSRIKRVTYSNWKSYNQEAIEETGTYNNTSNTHTVYICIYIYIILRVFFK